LALGYKQPKVAEPRFPAAQGREPHLAHFSLVPTSQIAHTSLSILAATKHPWGENPLLASSGKLYLVIGTTRMARRLLPAALVVALLAALVLQWKPARSVTLFVPRMAGFTQAGPDIWVERGTAAETGRGLVKVVALAQVRVREFYGIQIGRPVVLACSTPGCFRRCGGIGHATSYFGNRVLLGPSALNLVKVTHEFSHVELAARVGAVHVLLRVPQWFDEGLATVVSEDPAFDEAKWRSATAGGAAAPDLRRLETLSGWLETTKVDGQLSYGTARHEVARWYAGAGAGGIERLFAMLRHGYAFDDAYKSVK